MVEGILHLDGYETNLAELLEEHLLLCLYESWWLSPLSGLLLLPLFLSPGFLAIAFHALSPLQNVF